MKNKSTFLVNLTLICISLIFLNSCKNSKNSSEFSNFTDYIYKTDWSYEGNKSPETWADLSEEYKDCNGNSQAPVDISSSVKDSNLKPLFLDYSSCLNPEFYNNGHTILIAYNTGIFVVEGHDYNLKKMVFHCPGEFTFNGKNFPMEIQLMHSDADGNKAIISLQVKEGSENQFLKKIIDILPEDGDLITFEGSIDVNELIPAEKGYYFLTGSLTTPPCSENVKWFILKTQIEASKEQIEKFASLMPEGNNRPVQPLNGREIKEF